MIDDLCLNPASRLLAAVPLWLNRFFMRPPNTAESPEQCLIAVQ